MLFCYCFIDGVSHGTVGEVSGGAAAQFRDIERFSKIHFEQGTLAKRHRQKVKRSFTASGLAETVLYVNNPLHGGLIALLEPGGDQIIRRIVAIQSRETLLDLSAAAVAVHVPEATNVHQDVKTEALAGVK